MKREAIDSLDRATLVELILAREEAHERVVAALTARVAELEAKLEKPKKTPGNSSPPPSRGEKPSQPSPSKPRAKNHPGAHRALHPHPTAHRDVAATSCGHCGADVSGLRQMACQAYDHIEIPAIGPDVTRVTL